MKKLVFYCALILLVLVTFSSYEYLKFNDHDLHLVMCDVGQGDAIFITTPTKTQILIDGGPDKSVLSCLSNNMPFWDRSIDMVILTHPHADHYSGLLHVVDRYSLNGFFTQDIKSTSEGFKLLEAKLADRNLSAKHLKKNDKFSDKSGVVFKILWPDQLRLKEMNQNSSNYDLNESSIVALLTFGNFSALLTGDAEKSSIDQVGSGVKTVNVLKVPHHGSSEAVSTEQLDQLNPEIALISAGEGNKFGHPKKDTIDLLHASNVRIFRTDKDGEIEIISNGKGFTVTTKSR